MWILEKNGDFDHRDSVDELPVIDPETATIDTMTSARNGEEVFINFTGPADGRGFSIAEQLKTKPGRLKRRVATGYLMPDQARHAFQSGFDAIHISDELVAHHGVEAWRDALNVAVATLYHLPKATRDESATSIWMKRSA
ncbi:MAG: DUF934 domain-containing protein [Pseudomonadota bacterium]